MKIFKTALLVSTLIILQASAQTNILTLSILDKDTACHIALANHPTINEALHRMERAKIGINKAQSRYWPTISISAGATRIDPADNQYINYGSTETSFSSQTSGTGGTSTSFASDPETWYQANAQATWILFDGFARRASIAAAKFTSAGATATFKEAQRQILSSVIAAYLNAQSAREQMRIAQEDENFNEQLLQDALASQKAGTGSLSDVLNFRIKSNAAQSAVIFARRQLRVARIGLAILMGIENGILPETLKLAPLTLPTPNEKITPAITNLCTILNNRPDIQQEQAAVNRSIQTVKAAKSEYYPKIALSGSYNAKKPDDTSFKSDDFSSSVGVTLSYDIFAGGLHKKEVAEAREAMYEENARFSNIKLHATQELQNSIEQIRAAIEYLELQNKSVEYAQQNRDLTAQSYKVGQVPLVRMNEAQKDLTAAQVRQTQAVISLRQARNNYATATGNILKK